jgi:hypothetical protein
MRLAAGIVLTCILDAPLANAGGGLLGLDHELPLDQNGIWARSFQTRLEYGVVAMEVAATS